MHALCRYSKDESLVAPEDFLPFHVLLTADPKPLQRYFDVRAVVRGLPCRTKLQHLPVPDTSAIAALVNGCCFGCATAARQVVFAERGFKRVNWRGASIDTEPRIYVMRRRDL